MSKKTEDENTKFSIDRVKKIKEIYADQQSDKRLRNGVTTTFLGGNFTNAAQVRKAMFNALNNVNDIVEASRKLYAANPIYMGIIDYLANIYSWKYKVTPHKVYKKTASDKAIKESKFRNIYSLMLEAVDGLAIETKFPAILTLLFTTGSVYFTTICDEDSITIDTILLPTQYCRKVAETQYGTAIIQFDFSYFDGLGLSEPELNKYFKSFPKEFKTLYTKYRDNPSTNWLNLDPHFSSGLMLNEYGIPTYFYLYGALLNYEQYQDNELERSNNLLKYIVVHTMPHYEDKLIFEMDEVKAIHSSIRKIVETNDRARLVTTYGDVHVDRIAESDSVETEVLAKAYKTIFNTANLNDALFASDSVEALKVAIRRDKSFVWLYAQQILNFYNIAINNWFDFKVYQADIEILPISPYTYNDDMKVFKDNATLGVNKLDFIIASGIKQKNIEDQLQLESFLKLDKITPMQTSYTQTAEDRVEDEAKENNIAESSNDTSSNNASDENNSTSSANEPAQE